jgi:methoxymalonate biosynthesis acyl carrier protein
MPAQDLIGSLLHFIMTEVTTAAPANAPGPDTPLIDSGIVDSLGLFKLIAHIEDEFKVKIEPEDVQIENFATLNAIAGLIRSKASK